MALAEILLNNVNGTIFRKRKNARKKQMMLKSMIRKMQMRKTILQRKRKQEFLREIL